MGAIIEVMKIRDIITIKKEISDKKTSKTLTFIFFIATLSLVYLINNRSLERFIGKEKQMNLVQINKSNSEKKLLGCARKVDRDFDLLHISTNQENDCLFMGCGDFFQ